MDKKITYTNEVVDSYSGQTNCEAGVYVNDEIVGLVQYVLFEDELSISHIFVRPEFRRLGYGSKLMKYIKEENPDYHYVPSFKTDLGAAFKPKETSLTEKQDFVRDQDPIKSMGIGYGNKMKTDAWKILEFIKSKGQEGASFTEIQKFGWIISGRSEEDFHKKMSELPKYADIMKTGWLKDQRASRGWGVGKLMGSGYAHTRGGNGNSRARIGLLNRFCKKNEKGKWVLVRMPEVGEPLMERVDFEREGTPLDKLGIGENRFKPLVIDFLKIIENNDLIKENGFMNVGQSLITSDRIFDGFHELVTTWPKYKSLVNSMGLEIQDEPDLDETIFVPLKKSLTEKVNFEREGTPYEKMGIGTERHTKIIKEFLEVMFNTVNMMEEKFLNTGEDLMTEGPMLDAFRIFVNTWPKYKALMEEKGLTFDKKWDNKPGIEETIFRILPGFQRKTVSESVEEKSVIPQLEELTKEVDSLLYQKKMVPFRSIIKDVTRYNFHISSQVDFKEIHLTSHFINIHHLWQTLSDKGTNFKSRGGSQYWISDNMIYRLADHWGGVASCFWTIDGEGDPNFRTKKEGPFRIGWAHMKDFKPYDVRFGKQDLIDPKWCDEILKPMTDTLEDLEKIKEAIWEDPEVPGETKGFVGKHIFKYKKTISEIEENEKRMK